MSEIMSESCQNLWNVQIFREHSGKFIISNISEYAYALMMAYISVLIWKKDKYFLEKKL